MANVFLSSTGTDLHEYREAAYRAIEGLEGYHCVRMEDFGARDSEADDFCRRRVEECHLFVGIAGHLYGSSPKGSDKSYTEREYDAAAAANLPRLMFLAPEDFPVPARLIESDKKRDKQRAFRSRVSADRIRDTFTSPDDLARRVVQAIRNWEREQRTIGHRPSARPQGPIPLPPQPHFAHPYPLQENFTGRVRERRMLTKWLIKGDRPLLALVALGGMGKSALTWAWVQRDVLGLPLPGHPEDECEAKDGCRVPEDQRPEGVLWWSFHGREAGFAKFLDEALIYASSGSVDPASMRYAYDKVRTLINLRQHRLLLVLDGFERELHAYASLNAAYRGDDAGEDGRADFRSCTDPNPGDFLRRVAAGLLQSRVLLASRLLPRELDELGGCQHEELKGFDPEDAVDFFHAQGVEGTPAEIQSACKPYGNMPLALRLLSSLIARDKRQPGEIRVASRYAVVPKLKGSEERHILQAAYDALGQGKKTLLSRISAFRSLVSYEALSILTPYKEGTLDTALNELIDRGLLFYDSQRRGYDLHPVVRAYAYERLRNKVDVHNRLRHYFAALPAPEEEEVQSVEDLAPVIELYHDTVRAGEYDEARRLYQDRLRDLLYYRLGAYQTCIELLGGLFPDGEDKAPRLKHGSDQAWTLKELAKSYSLSGQVRRAVQMFKQQIAICKSLGDRKNLAIGLRLLAHQQVSLGELAPAGLNLECAIELCGRTKDGFEEALDIGEVGRLLAFEGAFDRAGPNLDKAYRQVGKLGRGQANRARRAQGLLKAYRAICALLQGDPEMALKAARRARKLARVREFLRDVIRAEWLLGEALVALAKEETDRKNEALDEPEGHLTKALTDSRRINLVEQEMDILLAWARWHRAKGDNTQARENAEEALAIADRCEYRLKQAAIHNFLEWLALDKGDLKEAKKHAEIAKERALCDGPPHCYKPALDEAERLLKKIERLR